MQGSLGGSTAKCPMVNVGVFKPKWVGPFKINDAIMAGLYKLEDLAGRIMPYTWNIEHIKKYY